MYAEEEPKDAEVRSSLVPVGLLFLGSPFSLSSMPMIVHSTFCPFLQYPMDNLAPQKDEKRFAGEKDERVPATAARKEGHLCVVSCPLRFFCAF